jgi:DNA-binding NarL/FixJ family response regulator
MDVTMPGMNGLEATQEISKLGLKSRVLIFTMHESKSLEDVVRRAGAHGFVFKSRAAHDLILGLQTLLAGDPFYGSSTRDVPPASESRKSGDGLLRLGFSLQSPISACA